MEWYYVLDGRQVGPLGEHEFQHLVSSGKVTSSTMVWRAGMKDWQPYSLVDLPAERVFCSECGKPYPSDELIEFKNRMICASCKPAFFQKLKEGALLPTSALSYATFWSRVFAKIIDSIILGFVYLLTVGATMIASIFGGGRSAQPSPFYAVFMYVIYFAASIAYNIYFLGKYGATPGKMAIGIKVVTSEGEKIDYRKALLRYLSELLSGVLCYAGYLMAAFDEENRTLHDRICDTRVIRN